MGRGKNRAAIRILVADDHTIFREGLCRLLEAEADITVVGEAGSGKDCLSMAEKLKPDVLLLDLSMPDQGGLSVLSELGGTESRVRTIVLTASEDERDYVESVRRGARGIVLKAAATERLLEGIRKVHQGEVWIDQRVATEVMKAMSQPSGARAARTGKDLLTPREGEIVGLVTRSSPKACATKISPGSFPSANRQ
jgi:DNA-binding NarL/FixJ family response regulator